VIEIADQQAIDECGPLDTAGAAAEQRCSRLAVHPHRAPFGDGVSLRVHCPDGGPERIDETAFGFVNDRRGQIFEAKTARIFGQAVGKRSGHPKLLGVTRRKCSFPGYKKRSRRYKRLRETLKSE